MKKQKVKPGLKFQNILQGIFRGSGFKHPEVHCIYLVVFIFQLKPKGVVLIHSQIIFRFLDSQ